MNRALAIVSICTLTVYGCKHNINIGSRTEREPIKVQTQTVCLTNLNTTRTYTGKVSSATDIYIKCPFPATLVKVHAVQGQTVKAGDALAQVYSESVESALTSAQVTYNQAKDASDRLHQVEWTESVPKVKIVEVDSQLARAEATLKTARKAKEDCAIKSPLAGNVSEILVKEGEDLGLAQPIFHIVDLNSLQITISVPESEISHYKVGDKAQVSIPSLDDRPFTGTLNRKGIDASTVSHSYECTIDLDSMPKGTMPGMLGKVDFIAAGYSGIIIPASAVYTGKDSKYVWIVGNDGKVEKRDVVTGDFAGKGILITNGLNVGDRLIVKGMNKVSTGMAVITQ